MTDFNRAAITAIETDIHNMLRHRPSAEALEFMAYFGMLTSRLVTHYAIAHIKSLDGQEVTPEAVRAIVTDVMQRSSELSVD